MRFGRPGNSHYRGVQGALGRESCPLNWRVESAGVAAAGVFKAFLKRQADG